MRQGAQSWCTEMTLRDVMGREVGGKVRMGNTRTSMADSCDISKMEGWDGQGGGRGIQDGEHMYNHG